MPASPLDSEMELREQRGWGCHPPYDVVSGAGEGAADMLEYGGAGTVEDGREEHVRNYHHTSH